MKKPDFAVSLPECVTFVICNRGAFGDVECKGAGMQMTTHKVDSAKLAVKRVAFGGGQNSTRMQGHWLLARAGKRVLRPGGIELTRKMLGALGIGPKDNVVEFAPGLGITAEIVLRCRPRTYCGVEPDGEAAAFLREWLETSEAMVVQAEAAQSGLPDASATVVYGEAMLSMQRPEKKNRIIAEAQRLLARGGRYGIHELCLLPSNISDNLRKEIQAEMAREIHVGVQPLTASEWTELLERSGLHVIWSREAPMHLLELRRILRDEGVVRSVRFACTVATNPEMRSRVFAMRRLFRRYAEHLGAISLVGRKTE